MTKLDESELPDFSGKVLLVDVAGANAAGASGTVIEYPSLQKVAGKTMLVGRVPAIDSAGWTAGCEVAISWDQIIQYTMFKSRDEFEKRLGQAEQPKTGIRKLLGG